MKYALLILLVLPFVIARWSAYCLNIALGWDLLLSAYTGGRPGETLSGRAGSAYVQGKLRGKIFAPIIDFVMRKKGHSVAAIKGDEMRAQAVLNDYARTP